MQPQIFFPKIQKIIHFCLYAKWKHCTNHPHWNCSTYRKPSPKECSLCPRVFFNLISMSKFCTNHNCILRFIPNICEFQDLLFEKLMGLGKVINGLNYWTPTTFRNVFHDLFSCITNNKISYCNTYINKTLLIFHQQLGHSASIHQPNCPICPFAKLACITFPHSTSTTSRPFALIHLDIWGPYHTLNHNGFRFFLIVVDDFSRAT